MNKPLDSELYNRDLRPLMLVLSGLTAHCNHEFIIQSLTDAQASIFFKC